MKRLQSIHLRRLAHKIIIFISLPSLATQYQVKQDENLSTILLKKGITPLYGKRGSIQKTLKLNPQLLHRTGKENTIFPDDILTLPSDSFAEDISLLSMTSPSISTESQKHRTNEERMPASQEHVQSSEGNNAPLNPSVSQCQCAHIQAQETQIQIQSHDSAYSELTVALGSSNIRINGKEKDNNTEGHLYSEPSQDIFLNWGLHHNDKANLNFGFNLQKVIFPNSNSRDLSGRNQILFQKYLGFNYQTTPSLSFETQIGQKDQLFYRATSTTAISLEKAPVAYGQLGLKYALYNSNSITYALKGAYLYNFSFENDHYQVNSGYGHKYGVLAEQILKNTTFTGEFIYEQNYFPAQEINYTRSEISILLGAKIKFGEGL